MLYPILCTCGRAIDDLSAAFRILRKRAVARELKALGRSIKPDNVFMSDDIKIQLDKDLTALGYPHSMICCRQVIMTTVLFSERY